MQSSSQMISYLPTKTIVISCLLFIVMVSYHATAQDRLKRTNGPILEVKINEVTSDEVVYHTYSNLSGPTYRVKINQLDWLKVNGEKDTTYYNKKPVINLTPPAQTQPSSPEVVTPPVVKQDARTKNPNEVKLEVPRTAADSARAYRNDYTNALVMIPEDREPLFKEVIYTFGGGTTTPNGDGHIFGNYGGNKNGNFYRSNGNLFAGLGGYFEAGITTRFSKQWGATINIVISTNGVNPNNIVGSGYESPDALPATPEGTLVRNELLSAQSYGTFNNSFITAGPVYFLRLTRRSDLMFHTGLGLGSVSIPTYSIMYKDQIGVTYNGVLVRRENYQENYSVGKQDNYFNGFAFSLNVRIKTYISNRVYLLGKVGYDGQVVNIVYRRSTNIQDNFERNISSTHATNNFVLGAAIGFGL